MNTNKCSLCNHELFSPLKLGCDHSFCYICSKIHDIKNAKYCPICITHISTITVLPCPYCKKSSFDKISNNNPLWIYEGKNYGWWLYCFKNVEEIEILYQHYINTMLNDIQHQFSLLSIDNINNQNNNQNNNTNKQDYKITIFNDEYIIDFEKMKQTSSKYMDRWRNIKRINNLDIFNKLYIKGISGYCFI